MTKVLYPGSFDPITKGHMDIILQASNLFDEVVIAVMRNSQKKQEFFSFEERLEIINKIYESNDKVSVVSGSGASVDIALLYGCKAIVRGLRSLSDYDYEVQLAQINKEISNGQINTICLLADKSNQFISSSMIRELYFLDKDYSSYVDSSVVDAMKLKRSQK